MLTSRQKMGAAALLMAASILLSRFMGLVRDKVISWEFGTGSEADIYFAAFVVPDFLNYLLAGGYISITLIPLLSQRFAEDEADAWRLFGAVLTWAFLAICLLTIPAFFFAPELAPLAAPGFSPEKQARLTTFLRIVLPAQIFFLPGACLTALLYIRQQFAVPALMPLLYNGFILLGGIILPRLDLASGMEGFCFGVTAGAAVGAFLLPLLTLRAGGFCYKPALFHPLLPRFLLLALPLMLGQSAAALDEQFVRIFGSLAGDSAVSLLNYARRIMMVPVGVVAQAAGVASFPFLAALAARGLTGDFHSTLNTALKNSLIVVMPVTAWMFASASPLLGLIFEGGSFGPAETAAATPLLRCMLVAVPFWALQQIMGRAFYARQNTLTPALTGTLATCAAIPAYLLLAPTLGATGVALVTTLSLGLYAMLLLFAARRHLGPDAFQGVGKTAWHSGLLVLPGFAASVAVTAFFPAYIPSWSPLARQTATLGLSGCLFAMAFLLPARLFVPELLTVLLAPLQKRRKKQK